MSQGLAVTSTQIKLHRICSYALAGQATVVCLIADQAYATQS